MLHRGRVQAQAQGAYDGQHLPYTRKKTGVSADLLVPAEARVILYAELHHSVGKDIIDNGGTKEQVKAVLAQRTDGMAAHYSDEYNWKHAGDAAIVSLERKRRQMENSSGSNGKLSSAPLTIYL